MPLLDVILDNAGAVGARIKGFRLRAERDRVFMSQPDHKPTRTKIITSAGKSLVFDVTKEVSPSFPSKITSFPVEDGANKSDHVVNENPTFTVTALVSDYSAGMNPEKGDMTQRDFYLALLEVRELRKEVSLVTPVDVYTSLIMTNVGFPRKTGDGVGLMIDLSFEQIRVAVGDVTTVFVTPSSKKVTGDTAVKSTTTKRGGKRFIPHSTSAESDVIDISAQTRWKAAKVEAQKYDSLL